MKFLIVGILCLLYDHSIAQKNLKITYKQNDVVAAFTVEGYKQVISSPSWVLETCDSVSFFHITKTSRKPSKKYSKDILLHHHSIYYKAETDFFYDGVLAGEPLTKYLVIDSIKERKWLSWDATKNILGYECKPFMSVGEANDTLLVWFTPNLTSSFGPSNYLGFPGLVLEVYDQKYDRKWYATKIEEVKTAPVIPADGIVLTKPEFFKLRDYGFKQKK